MRILLSISVVLVFSFSAIRAQNSVNSKSRNKLITGKVTDSKTGDILPGSTIVIDNTTIGTIADLNGAFSLSVPDSTKLISVSFLGYEKQKIEILPPYHFSIKLNPGNEEIDEVVVTAQALGQRAAISQQINSLTIKNVVSSERIRQNPDANAAEAIGRLPGISVTRNGGEADGLVVRGMQGYSNITINGIDVPVSLTSISQQALQNVEVFKSLSADMDASSPAGSVNLKMGTASDINSTNVMVQGGYNDLNQKFENYKVNVGLNHRLFEKKLGFSLNLSSESTDRSTEQLFAAITVGDQGVENGQQLKLQTQSVMLRDVNKIVKRNSASLVTDFRFSPNATIEWANILTFAPGGELNTDHSFSGDGTSVYNIADNLRRNNLTYSSILTAKHPLGKIKVDYALAMGYSSTDSKSRGVTIMARQIYPSIMSREQKMTLSHKEYIDLAYTNNDSETMNLYGLAEASYAQPRSTIENSNVKDMNIDARINMELPYSIGDFISGNLKWGGRYKTQKFNKVNYKVNYVSNYFSGILTGNQIVYKEDGTKWNDAINIPKNSISNEGRIMGSYLFDSKTYNNNFLGGGYPYGWSPNMDNVNSVLDWWYDLTQYAEAKGEDYWRPIFGELAHLKREDYNGTAKENRDYSMNHQAAYLMTQMKIGEKITFVPGVRYENYNYDMNAWYIHEEINSFFNVTGEPVNGIHNDHYFLPMLQFKYEPLKWLQGLFSYTNSVKRPSVDQLMPYRYEDKISLTYRAGNPSLKPELWTSYDVGLAVHGKITGLFSMTLFYKNVKDKIETTTWTKMSTDLTTQIGTFQPSQRVEVSEIKNHPYEGIAKGIEIEWQTSFWYLPKPFKYLTLNLNYTFIHNKTTYVYSALKDSLIGYGRGDRPIYEVYKHDTIVTGPMTNQPSHMFNASLGFSYKKFETWISYQYIGEIFLQQQVIQAIEPYKTAFSRLDLQVKYRLPVKGLDVLFNIANLTNTEERKYLRGDNRPIQIERYGWTSDLGIRYTF